MGQKDCGNLCVAFPISLLLLGITICGCASDPSKQSLGGKSGPTGLGIISPGTGTAQTGNTRKSGVVAAGGVTTAGSAQFDPLSSVKDGLEKVGELLTFTEPVQQAPDPTALSTKAKPSPRLYVAMARFAEESRQPAMAEQYYEKALSMDAKYLDALLGLGRLKDRQGQLEEALTCYQKATTAHPGEPTAWNHLGLCYARMNRLDHAKTAFEKAISLSPKESRYRHNLAAVLVQMGDLQGALEQLQAVHDEATAYYNLGYLLVRKGDHAAASRYFAHAVQVKPDFQEARQWLDALSQRSADASKQSQMPPNVELPTPVERPALPDQNLPVPPSGPAGTSPRAFQSAHQVAPLPPVLDENTLEVSDWPSLSAPRPLPPVVE